MAGFAETFGVVFVIFIQVVTEAAELQTVEFFKFVDEVVAWSSKTRGVDKGLVNVVLCSCFCFPAAGQVQQAGRDAAP
jgi:hypothetical protein